MLVAASPATAASTAPAVKAPLSQLTAGRYIVTLKAPAASGYKGANPKYAATYSRTGSFNSRSAAVAAYSSHLRDTQTKVAKSVGATAAGHLTMATNGFVADLSAKQAQSLATDSRVLLVDRSESLHVTSTNTADFLGMNGKKGAWAKHGGQKNAGAGIVIGDLDTGIWPESKSFKGAKLTTKPQTAWDISQTGTATTMEKADGTYFHGECEAGDGWAATDCTTKIISARYYGDGFTATVPPSEWSPYEQDSARDGGGHGSHTASTAAGEQVDNVTVEGRKFGTVVGMAPAAKLAVYKVCWEAADPDKSSCTTPDIVQAIDQAVADGVDVINYSIGGSASADLDSIQAAFEGAAEAGVFISASAGNSGPSASTLDNATPWITTVAASTYVNFENTLVLGNGKKIVGASISDKTLTDKPLVASTDVMAEGADEDDAKLCGPDTLGDASGDIVVCARGVYDRVAKSAEVKRAGGIGMVLINPSENSLDADFHSVPTIHISDTDGPKVYNYLASAGNKATASFKLGNVTGTKTPLPQVAGFSSRGPTPLAGGDLLKPDISAPGVSVLAAVAPPSNSGRKYDLYSGTSMAAPHITGLAAFIQSKHPMWTPAEIKSALMTTATPTKTAAGKASTDALAQGSGEVSPKKMFDPGLFVTSGATQWQGFIQSLGYDIGVDPVDAKQVNVPSMADGSVTGETSFTRTFRASRAGTWTIKGGVPGFTMHTSVKKIVSKRVNDLQEVTFTFTRDDAALGDYSQGAVTLSGPTSVRIPVALRPLSVDAPGTVSGTGTSGSEDVAITAGFTGNLDIGTHGMAESDTKSDSVAAGDYNMECVTVAADSSLARFEVDAVDADADIDMYVYASDSCDQADITAEVGSSATASGDEAVTLQDPDPGTYLVEIDGYAPGASGSPIPYDFDFWDIDPTTTAGDLTVTPNPVPVTQNEETSVTVSWSGLDADSHYLGFLSYPETDAITLVDVTS
ncbi:S8 family serine peptidase [Nocardioides mangrovi]|uniref:S8 family serine peptidase n=1 Tax=Nocardioides mangrovi TaxID=2874580 RepID=A0ABS7UB31_9ACTN|nr:S8 family serine peptidase [Nocardioides mangrovi]MBZ5738050.1 S8 family serine peptidase [Nocardioides mangrovi]